MTSSDNHLSRLTPIESGPQREAILDAISTNGPALVHKWATEHQIEELAANAVIQDVEASPDGLFWVGGFDSGGSFEAVSTIYVLISYSTASNASTMSDSIPAYFKGHIKDHKVDLDDVELDYSTPS